MKAMILAAGLGTRLGSLTSDRPKALVEVSGRSMLEITMRRLSAFGVREVIINVHHFADMVVAYLKQNNNFGLQVEISREEVLLDTGGGLKKAAWFFLEGGDENFMLHNVDVVSNIDLAGMVRLHESQRALATLAVQERETSRYLLFDSENQLCGRCVRDKDPEIVRPAAQPRELAFCGIHVISRRLLELLDEDGVFSIIQSYLRLAAAGEKILGFRADSWYWRDLGKPDSIVRAVRDAEQGLFHF